MRLVKSEADAFEVQHQGHKIGSVWHYQGHWHGETVRGTAVKPLNSVDHSADSLGWEIEALYKAGR